MKISALKTYNNFTNNKFSHRQTFTSKISKLNNDEFNKECCCKFDILPIREIDLPSKAYPTEYIKIENSKQRLIGHRLPEYFILYLESFRKGDGTKAIQNVVKLSLANSETQGRVSLYADKINPKQTEYPGGFYYKLGFRFVKPELNQIFDEWFKNGAMRKHAPQRHGSMYLPKANITQCLNY